MEPECSLPHSHMLTTCPYPEPTRSSPSVTSRFLKIFHNIIFPSRSGSSKWPLFSGFPTKTLYEPLLSPIRAKCPAHLILVDWMTRIIFYELYRSLSSSLCSFLHCPVTSSLLDPNILLITLFSNTLSLRSSLDVKGCLYNSEN